MQMVSYRRQKTGNNNNNDDNDERKNVLRNWRREQQLYG